MFSINRRAFLRAASGIALATTRSVVSPQAFGATNVLRHPTLGSPSEAPVDTLLLLANDCSGSMNYEELEIQRLGTAEALCDPQVRHTIRNMGEDGSVGIAVLEWGSRAKLALPWMDARSHDRTESFDTKLDRIADEIRGIKPSGMGETFTGTMMNFSKDIFIRSPWEAMSNKVLDISTDGDANGGDNVEEALKGLEEEGVTVNALAFVDISIYDRGAPSYMSQQLMDFLEGRVISRGGVMRDAGPDEQFSVISRKGRVYTVAHKEQGAYLPLKDAFRTALQRKLISELAMNEHPPTAIPEIKPARLG